MVITFVGSPNFNNRPKPEISLIVIHASASNSLTGLVKWFKNPQARVSAHYSIGKDGETVQHVKDNRRAWHAGQSSWRGRLNVNDFSIGIELVNLNDGIDNYPPAQQKACAQLCKQLVRQYSIQEIVGHWQISPGRKSDPKGFDLVRLRTQVYGDLWKDYPDGKEEPMTYRPGLWVTNGHPGDTLDVMYSWQPTALTCIYDHLGPNQVHAYKQQYPDTPLIIRFMHPHNWQDDPATSAKNLGNEVASKWNTIRDLDPYIYFANEVNLHYENGDPDVGNQHLYTSPEFYQRYADWVRMTADVIKQQVPDMRLVTPPFAFGHNEDGEPDEIGEPKLGWAGYDYLADTIRDYFNNILTFHAYWGDGRGAILDRLYDPALSSWYAFRWRRVLNLFSHRYDIDAKMIIDEAGNFNAGHDTFFEQIEYFSRECLTDSRMLALTFFLWYDPTNSPGNVPNSWVQKVSDLPGLVERLKVLGDISVPPPVEPPLPEPPDDYTLILETQPGLPLVVGDWPEGAGIPLVLTGLHGQTRQAVSGHKPEYGEGGFEFYNFGPGRHLLAGGPYSFTLDLESKFTKVIFQPKEAAVFDFQKYNRAFLASPTIILPNPKYGVTYQPSMTGDWQVIGVRHLLPEENGGKHNVYLEALDEEGKRVSGTLVNWTWKGRQSHEPAPPVVLDKPLTEPAGNLTMHWGQKIEVWIDGDRVGNLHTGHPDEPPGNTLGHHSFYVVFQRGEAVEPPPPETDRLPEFLSKLTPLVEQINDLIEEYA